MTFRLAAACALVVLALAASRAEAMPPLETPHAAGVTPNSIRQAPKPAGVDDPTPRTAVSGAWKTCVILIDFPDYRWDNGHDPYFANADSTGTYTPAHFTSMLYSDNTYRDPFAASAYTGSLRDFYRETSYGAFLVEGTVTVWYRAPHTYRYYCNTDGVAGTPDDNGWAKSDSGWVQDLVRDAVNAANPVVNFAQFDNNGDGTVDGLFVVHAGPGAEAVYSVSQAAAAGYIWSHKWSISSMAVDGVYVSSYTMEPEDGKVGVFCHEFGHDLGLPDLYDTDSSSEGVGEWDVMGGGGWCHRAGDPNGTSPSHFSAWSKVKLGWVSPVNVTSPRLGEVIPPVETSPTVYRLWTNGALGTEYFLVENRQQTGFDAGLTRRQFDYALPPAAGLVIWHVDDAIGGNQNELHRLLDVEEATPYWTGTAWFEQLDKPRVRPADQYLANANRGDNGDAWPGWSAVSGDGLDYLAPRSRDAFGTTTVPNSKAYSGAASGVALTGITLSGVNVVADLYTSTPTAVGPGADPSPASVAVRPTAPIGARGTVRLALATSRREVTVRILDGAGRRVRELFRGPLDAGEHALPWDGRGARGRVPAGVYLIRVDAAAGDGQPAESASGRLFVVR